MLDKIFEPFVQGSPITVMAAAAVTRLLSAERLDAIFDKSRQEQYNRDILFSSAFYLMAGVVIGTRNSIHHAYQTATENVGVSVVSVYGKLQNIETSTSQAIVRDMADQVIGLIDQMDGALPPLLSGYNPKILDGNCLASSEHRIKELRTTAAGALPGKSLVVLDPRRRVMVDVFPCQDGHAQERALLGEVLPTVRPDDLWINDRNFCVFSFLAGIAQRQAYFITRLHGGMACETQIVEPRELEAREVQGGIVYQRPVRVRGSGSGGQGEELELRRVRIYLEKTTRDGDGYIDLLTNLPDSGPKAVGADKVAELYRSRWKIETAFQELAGHLNSEINALGYPKAALFGFCVALVVFNAMSLMKAALRGRHGALKIESEVSDYYIAAELESTSRGMLMAIPPRKWSVFEKMADAQFTAVMLMLAGKVNLAHYKKHPRGPKKPQPKRTYDPAHPHVSTSKILDQRKPKKRGNT